MHLSDVIQDMAVTLLKTQERDIDGDALFQFEKGYLWERVLSRAFGEKGVYKPDELEVDGIILSPDAMKVVIRSPGDSGEVVVEEYKCTAISSNKSPADDWKWIMQVKGYCKALGATKCIFRVLHHMDIMWHPGECYRVWELVFTQGELDENWESVLNHAKTMKKGG